MSALVSVILKSIRKYRANCLINQVDLGKKTYSYAVISALVANNKCTVSPIQKM